MADPIQLANAAKAYAGLSHQTAAWNELQASLTPDQLQSFAQLYRADPPAKEPSPSPGVVAVDWLTPCRALVQQFEGCRLVAYPDPGTGGAPWTVGWGHTGANVKQGLTITQAQADGWLAIDLKGAHDGLLVALPQAVEWTANQQAALTSFVFNLGIGALQDSTLRRRLIGGDDPATVVREELPKWVNGGNGPLPGLVRRRAAEVELFCQSLPATTPGGPVWPAGLVGPAKRPDLKPGDHHLIANGQNGTLTAYSSDGERIWQVPCLCRGQGPAGDWDQAGGDTPPGLYLIGQVYRDWEDDPSPSNQSQQRQAFGWYSFDLIGQEGQEGPGSKWGRDGCMVHGGGTACGWPGAWAPLQELHSTEGCIRCHNQDLRDRLLPLVQMGRIWVSVLQPKR